VCRCRARVSIAARADLDARSPSQGLTGYATGAQRRIGGRSGLAYHRLPSRSRDPRLAVSGCSRNAEELYEARVQNRSWIRLTTNSTQEPNCLGTEVKFYISEAISRCRNGEPEPSDQDCPIWGRRDKLSEKPPAGLCTAAPRVALALTVTGLLFLVDARHHHGPRRSASA
jgi:hypothetical protein